MRRRWPWRSSRSTPAVLRSSSRCSSCSSRPCTGTCLPLPCATCGPFEQMVHSFLELLPLASLLLLAAAGPALRSSTCAAHGRPGLRSNDDLLPSACWRAVPAVAPSTRCRWRRRRWPACAPRRRRPRLVLLRALHPDERLQVDHVARPEARPAVQVAPDDRGEGQQRLVDRPGRLGLVVEVEAVGPRRLARDAWA